MNEEFDIEEMAPFFVLVITLVGGGLRVLLLASKGMWLDETFSVWVANQGLGDMLQWIIKIDQHPPLYYLLLHYWIGLNGDTPQDVRLLSALFGTSAIPIIYLIGKRISGAVVGLAAEVILALSPFHIYFAQETRMYTLLTFNAALAIYALVRLLTDSRSLKPMGSQFQEYHRWLPIQTIETDLAWVTFIVFSAATLLSHNTAVLFPLATNIFVLGLMLFQKIKKSNTQPAFQAPSFGNWVKAQIGIFLLWSPWLVLFIRQASQVDQEFWIPKPTWGAVIQVLKSFLNASAPLPPTQDMLIWSLYVLVLGLGLLHYRKKISQLIFLAALFAVPILGELIVSIRRPIFSDRTLIWVTLPLFLVLAAGVAQLRFRFLILGVILLLGTLNLFSASDYFRFYRKEDWSNPASYVAKFAEQGDLILFNSNFVVIPFDYYFQNWEDLYSIQVEKRGVPLDLFADGILEPKMTTDDIPGLISLVNGRDRVWLVYSHDSYTDPLRLIPKTLASEMTLVQQRNYYGVQVQLYTSP